MGESHYGGGVRSNHSDNNIKGTLILKALTCMKTKMAILTRRPILLTK